MLNRSASLAMSTSDLEALPGKLDIKRHSPSILYIPLSVHLVCLTRVKSGKFGHQVNPDTRLQTV